MWALLKIFKSGRSHMVMLTKPHQHLRNGLPPGEPELQVHTLNYLDWPRWHGSHGSQSRQ